MGFIESVKKLVKDDPAIQKLIGDTKATAIAGVKTGAIATSAQADILDVADAQVGSENPEIRALDQLSKAANVQGISDEVGEIADSYGGGSGKMSGLTSEAAHEAIDKIASHADGTMKMVKATADKVGKGFKFLKDQTGILKSLAGTDGKGEGAFEDFRSKIDAAGAAQTPAITGAYESVFGAVGGAESVDRLVMSVYDGSSAAAAKSKLVSALTKFAKEVVKKPLEGKSAQEVFAEYAKVIPDPYSDGKKTFATASHQQLCKRLADMLNRAFGQKIINENAGAETICRQVAEVVYSLESGLQSEFLGIYENSRRHIANLEMIQSAQKELADRAMAKLDDAESSAAKVAAQKSLEGIKVAQAEAARQLAMLREGVVGSLGGVSEDFDKVMSERERMYKLVENLKDVSPGTPGMSKVISALLRGIATLGTATVSAEKALKAVGITVKQYADLADVTALDEAIRKAADADLEKSEAIRAHGEILRQMFGERKELEKALGGDETSDDMFSGAAELDEVSLDVEGGAVSDYPENKKVKASLKEQELAMRSILRSFTQNFNKTFNEFGKNIHEMSKKLGTSSKGRLERTEAFDGFLGALRGLRAIVAGEHAAKALVGYLTGPVAEATRQGFTGSLKSVATYAESLAATPMYAHVKTELEQIGRSIRGLIGVVDSFRDEVQSQFLSKPSAVGGDDAAVAARSQVPSSIGDMIEEPLKGVFNRTAIDIGEHIDQIDSFAEVSFIMDNLRTAAAGHSDVESVAVQLNAAAIGDKINEIRRKLEADIKPLVDPDLTPANGGFKNGGHVDDDILDGSVKMVKELYLAKVRLWRCVESVDNYIRAWGGEVLKDPKALMDLQKVFNPVHLARSWYNDEAGRNLAAVFEAFPSKVDPAAPGPGIAPVYIQKIWGLNVPAGEKGDLTKVAKSDHYYKVLSDEIAQGQPCTPGNPYIYIPAVNKWGHESSWSSTRKLVTRAISGTRLLKNLVSAFYTIGAELSKETKGPVYPSGQLYLALLAYLEASAFSINGHDIPAGSVVSAGNGGMVGPAPVGAAPAQVFSGVCTGGWAGAVPAGPVREDFMKKYGAFMSSILIDVGNMFAEEDEFFFRMMRAMSMKVMAASGISVLLTEPERFSTLNPLRSILGGSEIPEVHTDATSFYLNAVLVLEFFKKVFGLESTDERTEIGGSIAMIPSASGDMRGLLNLMFVELAAVKPGQYSDSQVARIIAELNPIWAAHKSSPEAERAAITAIIAEVNRRVGLLNDSDRAKVIQSFNDRYKDLQGADLGSAAADALGDFDLDEGTVSLPSDQFLDGAAGDLASAKANQKKIRKGDWMIVEGIRREFDRLTGGYSEVNPSVKINRRGYQTYIREYTDEIAAETDASKRFAAIANLIKTDGDMLSDNSTAAMYALHELVQAPLSLVDRTLKLLESVDEKAKAIDALAFDEAVDAAMAAAANQVIVDSNADPLANFVAAVQADPNIPDITLDTAVYNGFTGAGKWPAMGYLAGVAAGGQCATQLSIAAFDDTTIGVYGAPTAGSLNAGAGPAVVAPGGATGALVTIAQGARPGSKEYELFKWLLLARQSIFSELVDTVASLVTESQGLIKVSFVGDRLTIDSSKLKETLGGLLGYVRSSFDKLSPMISDEPTIDAIKNELQAIEGRFRVEVISAGASPTDESEFDLTCQRLNKNFKHAVRKFDFDINDAVKRALVEYRNDKYGAADINVGAIPAYAGPGGNAARYSYPTVLPENLFFGPAGVMVFRNDIPKAEPRTRVYSGANVVQDIAPIAASVSSRQLLTGEPSDLWKALGVSGDASSTTARQYSGRVLARVKFIDRGQAPLNTAMFAINQLVLDVIDACYDETSEKCVKSVVKTFSDVFSTQIGDKDKSFSDFYEPGNAAGWTEQSQYGWGPRRTAPPAGLTADTGGGNSSVWAAKGYSPKAPQAEHLLLSSLCTLIRNLYHDTNSSGQRVGVWESTESVPEHVREKIRGNLPLIHARVAALRKRIKIFQQLLDSSADFTIDDKSMFKKPHDTLGGSQDGPADGTQVNKGYYTRLIANLLKLCETTSEVIETALKSVGGAPEYFEDRAGAMREILGSTGKLPHANPSGALSLGMSTENAGQNPLIGVEGPGSSVFGLKYATSFLFARDLDLKRFSGWQKAVDAANNSLPPAISISAADAAGFGGAYARLLRFNGELAFSASVLSKSLVGRFAPVAAAAAAAPPAVGAGMPEVDFYAGGFIRPSPHPSVGVRAAAGGIEVLSPVVAREDYSTRNAFKDVFPVNKPQLDNALIGDVVVAALSTRPGDLKRFILQGMSTQSAGGRSDYSLAGKAMMYLRVVPIQPSLFAKELPLAATYNWDYAARATILDSLAQFSPEVKAIRDQLRNFKIIDTNRLPGNVAQDPLKALPINSPLSATIVQVFNPFHEIEPDDFRKHVGSALVGVDGAPMGRPQFASDAIWASALLGNLYRSETWEKTDPPQPQSPGTNLARQIKSSELDSLKTAVAVNVIDPVDIGGNVWGLPWNDPDKDKVAGRFISFATRVTDKATILEEMKPIFLGVPGAGPTNDPSGNYRRGIWIGLIIAAALDHAEKTPDDDLSVIQQSVTDVLENLDIKTGQAVNAPPAEQPGSRLSEFADVLRMVASSGAPFPVWFDNNLAAGGAAPIVQRMGNVLKGAFNTNTRVSAYTVPKSLFYSKSSKPSAGTQRSDLVEVDLKGRGADFAKAALARYNTTFIRKQLFLTQLQRLLIHRLSTQADEIGGKRTLSGRAAINPRITEFSVNEEWYDPSKRFTE